MTYDTLLKEAFEAIPEFKSEYDKKSKSMLIDNVTGLHVVFSYIFSPLLFRSIKENPSLAKKMFLFLERMEESQDRLVSEVCEFTVLEELADTFSPNEIEPLLGSATREGWNLIKRYIN